MLRLRRLMKVKCPYCNCVIGSQGVIREVKKIVTFLLSMSNEKESFNSQSNYMKELGRREAYKTILKELEKLRNQDEVQR